MPTKPRDRLFVTLSPSKRAALERLRAALEAEKDTTLIGLLISHAERTLLPSKKRKPQDEPGQTATDQEEKEGQEVM